MHYQNLIVASLLAAALGAPIHAEEAQADGPAEKPATNVGAQRLACDFEAPDSCSFDAFATGEAERRKALPKLFDGKLYLLESWWKSTACAAFAPPAEEITRTIDASWTLVMNTGTEGAGFAWLNVNTNALADGDAAPPSPDKIETWEAPSLPGSFAVGFDASNPPNRDPFRGSGNVYDRPQHEVSLHWDSREIIKKTTETEFRDEKPHAINLHVEFIPGGANVTLRIDDETLFDAYFIPSMQPYVGRPVFGARNAETAGDVLLDDLEVRCGDPIQPFELPLSVTALDRVLNDAKNMGNDAIVEFPENTDRFARIICTLRLDEPEGGFDPWDRLAEIRVVDDKGVAHEILRYITPYDRGFEWKVDVTDFRPLLRGKRKIEQFCETYASGWLVTVKFDFYPGPVEELAYEVVSLWSGRPEIGNAEKPINDFFTPRTIPVEPQTTAARIRTVVTGHGMSPNTGNAAEFMPIGRTLTVNDKTFRNVLWKTDNYLNPCRPQGGTWKYDRAGWAPGDIVGPWEVDITPLLTDAKSLQIGYALDPYTNEARGKASFLPFHRTEAHLILYRQAASSAAATDTRESAKEKE